jgi:hypothetical protein
MEASVVIGMPTYGPIQSETMFSLIALILRGGPLVHDLDYRSYMYIDQSRNSLVKRALDTNSPKLFGPVGRKSSHLLYLDADMTWPSTTIARLLAHKQPVVGGLYFLKGHPYNPIIGDLTEDGRLRMRAIAPHAKGLVKVDCVGTGCLLVDLDVFREMRRHFEDDLWFRSQETGEDIWFFQRLKQMGIPAFCDVDIDCGHLTKQIINRKKYNEMTFPDGGNLDGPMTFPGNISGRAEPGVITLNDGIPN